MKSARKDGKVDSAEARDALRRILDSGFLKNSPKLERFLRFVANEELEGRGELISPHAIAVKALGRRESFDPKTDPVVRVFASRLRAALSAYYEGAGSDDPVRIEIPRGGYRPSFSKANREDAEAGIRRRSGEGTSEQGRGKPITSTRLSILTGLLATVVLAVGGLILHLVTHGPLAGDAEDIVVAGSENVTKVPIVEVLPFDANVDDSALVERIRERLIIDLSQFRSLRVRRLPSNIPDEVVRPKLRPSEYQIAGSVTGVNDGARLEFHLRDMASRNVIWSGTVELPRNDAEYQDLLLAAVRSIVPRLAGISGVIRTEAIARLEQRHKRRRNRGISEYECLIKFYAYDLRKSGVLESDARRCLKRLTKAGSRDSSIWSSWALMRYLDWARLGGPGNSSLLQDALEAVMRAIALDPGDANAHEICAMIYTMMGERDAALKTFQRALALNPSKPDLYSHFGDFYIYYGDWKLGIELVRAGIAMSPGPPGWMRIPLSLDAFRRGDYPEALQEAQLIIASGDKRAVVLALAAAIALDDEQLARKYYSEFTADGRNATDDPMRELRVGFPDPELIEKYEKILAGFVES